MLNTNWNRLPAVKFFAHKYFTESITIRLFIEIKYTKKEIQNHWTMITSNPYNLPDKILKPNQIMKPITLQNKKSRDRSYDYSKEVSTKGIKI